MDIRRFGAQYRSPAYTHARVQETYETYYDIRYPNHERSAGRPLRISPPPTPGTPSTEPPSARSRAGSASTGTSPTPPRATRPCGRAAGPASIGRRRSAPSTRATREAVALFDETSFAKMEIEGTDAAEFVESLCDNKVAREIGKLTYTQMLNPRGGIECDFTVAQAGRGPFLDRDRDRLRQPRSRVDPQAAPGGHGSVQVHDTTAQLACFGIWGPLAREVLQPLTPQSLANDDFPYMTVREITVGNVPVRALRVTYVGELGWELYCPTEYGLGLWNAIWAAGEPHGIVAGGYRAIDSMRLEKGYRVWGADITPDETPTRAASASASSWTRRADSSAGTPWPRRRSGPAPTRLCCLLLEDPRSVALGNEPVRVDGEICGRVTSGGYGYTVERSIAYAYLPPEHAEPGTAVAVEIFGRWVEGEVASEPLFDPEGKRIRTDAGPREGAGAS